MSLHGMFPKLSILQTNCVEIGKAELYMNYNEPPNQEPKVCIHIIYIIFHLCETMCFLSLNSKQMMLRKLSEIHLCISVLTSVLDCFLLGLHNSLIK